MTIKVSLRTVEGHGCRIRTSTRFKQLAMQWTYRVRNRNRWMARRETRNSLAVRAAKSLEEIGVTRQHLRQFARDGIVEVSIPSRNEEDGWEARIFPWEYLLTAATRRYRDDQKLFVVRHLSGRRAATRDPKTLAILEAAPGPFRESYDFAAERSLIQGSLSGIKPTLILDPTRTELQAALRAQSPDVIHVTGIDAYLGAELLRQKPKQIRDGVYLTHRRKRMEVVEAEPLAKALNAGHPNPLLVGFNCWESGARLAPFAVRHGASAALGFQNTFDDAVAEAFFFNFYRAWRENEWDLLSAFLHAWGTIEAYHERVRGSGIILWSASSLIRHGRIERPRQIKRIETRFADPDKDQIRDMVHVEVEPIRQINYALLHNGRSMFEKFQISFAPGAAVGVEGQTINAVANLEVEALLHVGSDSFPFRTMVQVGADAPLIDLTEQVHMALTSELARSIKESVQTNLFVQVRCGNQLVYQNTFAVRLAPVNEWKLTELDIWWLPSFVQSGDPAVAKILEAAQRYLMALMDDAGAGFAGYQCDDVDPQVQAIWSALVFDFRLKYINPPPSFTADVQRLRTPSQVVSQGRGTCVDLAVLLAACLEGIEVYPVIFMLNDHAFPGYWRSEVAHTTFSEGGTGAVGSDRPVTQTPWVSDSSAYAELKKYVDEDELIPLESVNLTIPTSFDQAWTDAKGDYFGRPSSRKFHSMIDMVSARQHVTPLPLWRAD